jgi:4-hydroxy-2-oxoheptanedioate aldolase
VTVRAIRSIPAILREQGFVLNSYCQMPGAFAAEIYSRQGWDAIMLDLQHGVIAYDTAVAMLQAICASGVTPLVRIPPAVPAFAMQMLDAGALGVIGALVNTRADAEALVAACRYPPLGARSLGPARAAVIYGDGYVAGANTEIAVMAMVETAEAVDNVEDILAVEGLDGIYIGPADLAMSLGCAPDVGNPDPRVAAAIERVRAACAARGRIVGMIAPTPAAARKLIDRGFTFVTLASDAQALRQTARNWVTEFRALPPGTG